MLNDDLYIKSLERELESARNLLADKEDMIKYKDLGIRVRNKLLPLALGAGFLAGGVLGFGSGYLTGFSDKNSVRYEQRMEQNHIDNYVKNLNFYGFLGINQSFFVILNKNL